MAHVKAERDILAEADNEWVVKLYYSFQVSFIQNWLLKSTFQHFLHISTFRTGTTSTLWWITYLVVTWCLSSSSLASSKKNLPSELNFETSNVSRCLGKTFPFFFCMKSFCGLNMTLIHQVLHLRAGLCRRQRPQDGLHPQGHQARQHSDRWPSLIFVWQLLIKNLQC